MTKILIIISIFSILYPLSFSITNAAPITSLFNKEEVCDPAIPPDRPPKKGGGCDLVDLLLFIRRIIEFLLIIIIPIGVIFVGWGAFVIMTAAGSEEKFRQGKGIITAAIIGIAIALASWLIVTVVNKILTGYLGEL